MPRPSGRPAAPPDTRMHRARYRRIVRFAALVLAQTWWYELVLPRVGLRRLADRTRTRRLQNIARRFFVLAADLGGLMIKVGQFLSSRIDVLPPEVTRELEGLQDEVAPEPFDAIRRLTEAELGIPLESAYTSFDPVPIAAASLGQAHRARLTPSLRSDLGFEDVVVKVQRPGIEAIVAVDLAALRRVAGWLSRVRLVSSRADAPALVEEFAATSMEEIDYLHEAANAERFAADVADDLRIGAPGVVWERTSLRTLTLSDVTAIKVTDVEGLRAAGIDPAAVAQELARAAFQQIFVSGFFHADPHPGNLFVTPLPRSPSTPPPPEPTPPPAAPTPPPAEPVEASSWRIDVVDFGMMGEISDSLRAGLRDFILATVGRDVPGLVTSLERLGVLLPSGDTEELERAMTALFDRFGGMGVAELRAVDPRELERFGRQFGETVRSLPFQLPESFLLLLRTISLVSGVTSALDPDFNMWDAVEPFARTVLRSRGSGAVRDLPQQALGLASTLARLPRRADELATRLERGRLAVRTPDLDRRMRGLERTVGRLVSAVLFAALLIAGVLLRPDDEVLGWILIAASALPLIHVLIAGRRR